MEKLSTDQSMTDYLEYVSKINGNFDWVNKIFMETSQTVIDLDKKNVAYTEDELNFLKEFSIELSSSNPNPNLNYINFESDKNTQLMQMQTQISEDKKDKRKFLKNKTVKASKKCKLGHM